MIEIKKFTEEELKNILEEIKEKAEKTARFETDLRKEFFNKLEKEVKELKEKSRYDYILDFKEVNIPSYSENYFNERKSSIIETEVQKYFYYDISSYTVDNFITNFKYQCENIKITKNKVKFNINILDSFGDLSGSRLFKFFTFFNTISGIDIPEWDYRLYYSFNEFNVIYTLNDNIQFKVYKNGKIEIITK